MNEMNDTVRQAHVDLNDEISRLAAAYQRSLQGATLEYEQGLLEAQLRFEEKLRLTVIAMTKAMENAL